MRKKMMLLAIVPLSLLGLALNAFGQLTAVGPINAANGFPLWFESPGLRPAAPPIRLQLCLTGGPCELDAPIAGNPFSQQIGFGRNAFWWGATADIGRLATLEMGVKTSWAGGVVRDGNQRVSNFIRIDVRNLPAGGLYVITHPFGVERINVVADAAGRFNIDFVRGITSRNFGIALNGPVTRFLRGRNAAPGFIGNASVPQQIVGSPNGTNFFRVQAPAGVDIGGAVRINVVSTGLFNIQGDVFP